MVVYALKYRTRIWLKKYFSGMFFYLFLVLAENSLQVTKYGQAAYARAKVFKKANFHMHLCICVAIIRTVRRSKQKHSEDILFISRGVEGYLSLSDLNEQTNK